MHYWTVWHENKDFSAFYAVKPRFCSEFGFQSFSSMEVARTFCPPEQLNPTAPLFEHHQKHKGGNARILETMARYFRFPDGIASILYLSQVQQALAIKTATEAWRHLQPRCMGTLYWQLNDNWPVASWSSVEYTGKWKHLHYHAKRFFAPVAVMVVPADNDAKTLEVWAVNDHDTEAKAEVTLDLWNFTGKKLETVRLPGDLPPRSSTRLARFPASRFAGDKVVGERFLAVELHVQVAGTSESHRNEWFFTRFKNCNLDEATVVVTPVEREGRWMVTLSTDKPALFVWANVVGIPGEFDDNSFLLVPDQPVTLTFTPKAKASFADFKAALTVTHLRQTYAAGQAEPAMVEDDQPAK
jgi:beta-mannosidase